MREVQLPGIGTVGRLRRQADRHRDLLRLLQLRHPADHLPLRHGHRHEPPVPPAGGEVQPGRLRGPAGLLPQQGRHAGADVHRPQERAQARRLQPHAALRLRRLQHLAAADVLGRPAGLDGDGRRLRPAQPPRRRRVRRGLAQGRHASSRSRTSSTTSSPPPSGSSPTATPGPTGWPSRAAATAACWSAR